MSMESVKKVSIAEAVMPVMSQVDPSEFPMFVAVMEQMVGEHYRRISAEVKGRPEIASQLLECADREDDNANAIVETNLDKSVTFDGVKQKIPQMEGILNGVFEGLSLSEQCQLIAEAEQSCAEIYRGMVDGQAEDVVNRLLHCADLEEKNAKILFNLAKYI